MIRPSKGLSQARWAICAGAAAASLWAAPPAFAQVVIDGSTNTTVTLGADGAVTVGVAPSTSNGVSLNRYNSFNVPTAGVALDNRAEAARTIVNEVTGTGGTAINGTLEVLGQRAHVIVANPNGIVIDNGHFVNTGRVALTTGAISTTTSQIAPGIFQLNAVSTVNGGSIVINGGGLSGQMDALDLIARDIQVNGPISNDSIDSGSSLRLAGGSSSTEFDSSVVPGNTDLTWGTITGAGATSDGAVLVDILRGGVLRAHRISIEVSDKGAGVRMAANGMATSRSFVLTADGKVTVSDAALSAVTGIVVAGTSATLTHSSLTASQGPISLEATATAATADGITLQGTNISASDVVLTSASQLAFTDSTITATTGTQQITAKGALISQGTVASAFAHLLVTADAIELTNTTTQGALRADNGTLILTTTGTALAGDLVNRGGLIVGGTLAQGLTNSAGTTSDGAVTLNVAGKILNASNDTLAVIFGAGGDVSLRSVGSVENNHGRILSNGDLRVIAQGDVLNMMSAAPLNTAPQITETTTTGARQWWTLWIKRKRSTTLSYDYGTLINPDQVATMTASGKVVLQTGGALVNQGGTINANGGDLDVTALRVQTIGLGSGKLWVSKVCILACSYTYDGAITYSGGTLNAANDLRITATTNVTNTAGQIYATNAVNITAPEVTLTAAVIPTVVPRPRGMYNFWQSKSAWLFLNDTFGSIMADTGKLSVQSQKPVQLIGGSMTAGAGIELSSGQTIVRTPRNIATGQSSKIGFFAGLPLIRQD